MMINWVVSTRKKIYPDISSTVQSNIFIYNFVQILRCSFEFNTGEYVDQVAERDSTEILTHRPIMFTGLNQ